MNAYSRKSGDELNLGKSSLGNLASLPKEDLKALAKKGGEAHKGVKRAQNFTKCKNCELRDTCERAFEEGKKIRALAIEAETNGNPKHINIEKGKNYPLDMSRCAYELEHTGELKNKVLKSFKAFTSEDPKDLLKRMHLIYTKLEGQVDASPSFAKYAQLYYMLANLYKLRFDGKVQQQVNIQNNLNTTTTNATLDVKTIMDEIRKKQATMPQKQNDADTQQQQG